MKNAASTEKLTSTGTDIANRVKNLFSGSPVSRRRRAASADTQVTTTSPPNPTVGVPLNDLLAREGLTIPFIVKKIVEHIEEQGLDQVGIYRINGNVKSIEKLRAAFDKVGDADFNEEDLPTVAGLLKLFLRELPDSVIPEILVPHFVSVQQSYSGSTGTPEALDALSLCLHYLPEPNYNVLKYLIKHLATVAEYTDMNKMTSVSLSIVFGPNLMHCGDGLEGLRMQGYSNSLVCQLIRYYKELFGRQRKRPGSDSPTKPQPKRAGGDTPSKPLPYAEYVAGKKDQGLVASGGHVDLDTTTHSERSIDDAILERSNDTLSPIMSPRQLPQDDLRPLSASTSASTSVNPSASEQREELMAMGSSELGRVVPRVHSGVFLGEDAEDLGAGFQRRNAKRGMIFKPRDEVPPRGLPEFPSKSDDSMVLRPPQLSSLSTGEDDFLARTPSPYSHSSPGTSPPTSPVVTPRASSVVNSAIGASIRDYLFRPAQLSPGSASSLHSQGSKQNVYGLLLPDPMSVPAGKISNEHTTSGVQKAASSATTTTSSSGRVETAPIETGVPLNGVVKRRVKNMKGQRNRKSALHGEDFIHTPHDNQFGDMNVQIMSVSPEHKNSLRGGEGVAIESRTGKVLDLVKQYDDEDDNGVFKVQSRRLGSLSTLGEEDGVESAEAREQSSSLHENGGEGDNGRRKLNRRSLDLFEKSGIIMGMVKPKVSFSSTTATITHDSTSSQAGVKGQLQSSTLGSVGSDEEVFGSPHHHPVVAPDTASRGHLSTTTSDDVFLPTVPSHKVKGHADGAGAVDEFDDIPPTATLQHLTLSRPKGPPSRRKPRHHSDPDSLPPSSFGIAADSSKKRHSHDILETWSSDLEQGATEERNGYTQASVQLRKVPTRNGLQDRRTDREPLLVSSASDRSPSSISHRIASHPPNSTDPTPHQLVTNVAPPHDASTFPNDSMSRQPTSADSASLLDTSRPHTAGPDSNPHPLASTDSTPSSSPSIHAKPSGKENRAVAPLDLMSLAPEQKQVVSTVKRGWSEGGGAAQEGEKNGESTISMKEIARKMHELKNSIRDFEAKFVSQHQRKPSNHEKSPVRSKLIELAKLKKLFKEKKESANEERLSRTAPAEGSSTSRLLRISEASTSEHLSPRCIKRESLTSRGVTGQTHATSTVSPLERILNRIMSSLDAHRKAHNRPEELGLMSAAQIQEEKHAIQKLLLNYEKHHGRPQSHTDKEVMRPLYDRYRAVKRVCSGSGRERENSKMSICAVTPRGSTAGYSLSSTTDTLPTVTLMASLMESVELGDLSKSGGYMLSSEKQIEDDRLHTEERPTEGNNLAGDGRGNADGHVPITDGCDFADGRDLTTNEHLITDGHMVSTDGHGRSTDEHGLSNGRQGLLDGAHGSRKGKRRNSSLRRNGKETKRLFTEEEFHTASLAQLQEQNSLLIVEKSELRRVLRDFESGFTAMNGRNVTRQDRKPMEKEYNQYKIIKTKLRTLELLMAKMDPHKTI